MEFEEREGSRGAAQAHYEGYPSRLTITSFFQRKDQKPVINDGTDILEDIVATDSVVSSDVGDASECKVTASNVERYLALSEC